MELSEDIDESINMDKYSKSFSYYFIRRLIHICGSLIGITILSSVIILAMIAIKLDSKRPIIFSQERVGKTVNYLKCINSDLWGPMQKSS